MRNRIAQHKSPKLARLFGMCICLFLLAAGPAVAEPAISLFGPKTFQKGADTPDVIQESFTAPPDVQELRVVVKNGPGGKQGVKSARIILNDVNVFETADFHSAGARSSKDRARSLPLNQLQVILRGVKGGSISVQVLGVLPLDPGKKPKK